MKVEWVFVFIGNKLNKQLMNGQFHSEDEGVTDEESQII